jgi:hypothetical protein
MLGVIQVNGFIVSPPDAKSTRETSNCFGIKFDLLASKDRFPSAVIDGNDLK